MNEINEDSTAELMAFPLNTLDDRFLQHLETRTVQGELQSREITGRLF